MAKHLLKTLGVELRPNKNEPNGYAGLDANSKINQLFVPELPSSRVGLENVDNTSDLDKPISLLAQQALDTKVPASRKINTYSLNTDITLTKADIGLTNVDNTSDINKPISTATQTALDGKVPIARTINTKPLSNDISLNKTDIGLSNVDNTSDDNKPVSIAVQTALDGKVSTSRTINGQALTSNISLTKTDLSLGNVDNTSDANKPVSTATQTALNAKVNTTLTINTKPLTANISLVKADVGLSNVDNTSDANKPVSTATQTALNLKENTANKNVADGYVGINANRQLPAAIYGPINNYNKLEFKHIGFAYNTAGTEAKHPIINTANQTNRYLWDSYNSCYNINNANSSVDISLSFVPLHAIMTTNAAFGGITGTTTRTTTVRIKSTCNGTTLTHASSTHTLTGYQSYNSAQTGLLLLNSTQNTNTGYSYNTNTSTDIQTMSIFVTFEFSAAFAFAKTDEFYFSIVFI